MSTFKYSAKDSAGKTVSGTIDAANQIEATESLRRKNLQVMKVTETRSKDAGGSGGFFSGMKSPKPKKGELELFTRQLSTMVSAGIPLLECLEILEEQAESAGFRSSLGTVIEEIRSGSGEVFYRRLEGSGPGRVIEATRARQVTDMMRAVVAWGSGKAANPGRPAAGKTGTSQNFRDAWFIGFTADYVAGVWMGYDDNTPLSGVYVGEDT